MESVTWIQILDEGVSISLCIYAFWKGMSPSVLCPDIAKYQNKLGSLALVKQPGLEKENSEFKQAIPCLEIDLVLHPAYGREVG